MPTTVGKRQGQLLEYYATMFRIRAFEETAIEGQRQNLVLGALHPYIGQEAIAVGVIAALRSTDIILSTHRGHGHSLAKGASPNQMMMELFGRAGGTSGGRGGSMHIADFGVGMLGANGVVAANIVIASGAAHAVKMRGEDHVVVCFIGDGAVNRGPFLEGLNWASVFDLPVLFVCEDNIISATTSTPGLTGGKGAAARAASLGLRVAAVDGNDPETVGTAAAQLLDSVRTGEGPAFLHLSTYRLLGHTSTDAATYRAASEVEEHWADEPLLRARHALLERGVREADIAAVEDAAGAEMQAAFDAALAAPRPSVAAAYQEVQDAGTPEEDAY